MELLETDYGGMFQNFCFCICCLPCERESAWAGAGENVFFLSTRIVKMFWMI